MDKKALYSLSYGVFLLATKSGEKANACITNTGIQVANDPTRIAISVINSNYTCELLKESGVFTLSLLDQSVSFDTIKYFGMQSGRTVDKLGDLPLPEDARGIPYMGWGACAYISGKVVSSQDLGSHTLFIAEVVDAAVLSDKEPLTYAYYQSDIKPKPAAKPTEKKIVGWRCTICNHVYEGAELPADYTCPLCGHPAEDFEPIYG
ncbi:MAG: flavin reductase [Oscillospiraceae bacterium]|nr:flavin reductase [Oscillospiraceae bacterium]